MLELNLLAPKGKYTFGDLVSDSFMRAGVKVNWLDYRASVDPRRIINRDAPILVLRGESIDNIARILDWHQGKRFLWYAEDCSRDQGKEFMSVAAYYDDIFLHWPDPNVLATMQRVYQRKRVSSYPVLYCNQDIWTVPDDYDFTGDYEMVDCEVLHYGSLTPRREKVMAEVRSMSHMYNSKIVFDEVVDANHPRLARHVRRSKVILNIHAWSDVNLEVRIAEAMSVGSMIVSEAIPMDCGFPELIDPKGTLIALARSGDAHQLHDHLRTVADNYWDLHKTYGPKIIDYARKNFSHLKIANDVGPAIFGKEWQ
jgi:hypothetical protein